MASRSPRSFCIALLAASLALSASADVQLLPAGEFTARDGRPGKGKTWKLSDLDGKKIAADLTALAAKTRFLFDYDHQTIRAQLNGQKAPAAGWATTFEWRPGQGLYATNVEWTKAALVAINADEYSYVSPVIAFEESTGRVVGVQMAAITNYPAVLGMEPLGQALTAQLSAQFSTTEESESSMKLLAALAALFALPATATEDDAIKTVTAFKADADALKTKPAALSGAIVTALGLKADADETAALSAIGTLINAGAGTGATQAIAALQAQVATLTAQATGNQVEALVAQGLADGKLLPAMKDWAVGLGKKDVAELQGYLAKAPKLLPGTGGQSGGKDPGEGGTGVVALTAENRETLALMGITEEAYVKQYGAKQA